MGIKTGGGELHLKKILTNKSYNYSLHLLCLLQSFIHNYLMAFVMNTWVQQKRSEYAKQSSFIFHDVLLLSLYSPGVLTELLQPLG